MVDMSSRPTPATPQEQADIETLSAIMGGNLDEYHALTLLRKHNNNLEKAASALLEGDTGADDPMYADLPRLEPINAPVIGPGPRTPPPSRPEKGVIDLTKDDDDELARALRASLEDHTTRFGPSERAPDPNWAVVPSNVEASAPAGMSQDDQAMSQAIEASLSYTISEDVYHELPLEQRVRQGDTPVALRPTLPSETHAALILHGLFFVPQFKHTIAQWLPLLDPGASEMEAPTTGTAYQAWSLLETYTHMDYVRMTELTADAPLRAFAAECWSSPAERPGDVSARFYEKLVYAIENVLQYNNINNPERKQRRLMELQYGEHNADPDDINTHNLSVVRVNVRSSPESNDLLSALSAEFAPPDTLKNKATAKRHVIVEPSEVIAFELIRDATPPSYDAVLGRKSERSLFKYPKSLYLDQFMQESFELANEKRMAQRGLLDGIKELEARKKNLLNFNDKDTLADLRSCLYYYEHVAESKDDPQRAEEIKANKEKLSQIIEKIEEDVRSIDTAVAQARDEAQGILDCPELQKHRYDLRVVLVHDGLYGRSHLYSYVKQKGKWWKTVDYAVTEVSEETVLTDSTGLHLAAGPYFLIYSRALPQEEEDAPAEWPVDIKNNVKHNNQALFSHLPPDVLSRVVDPNSPPSSPVIPPTPSEYTISSDIVEPSESRGEPMDTTD
ncbi:hypothetical protein OH76DRAFT_1466134 [Lentinus brumalis]|uniref:ubiquitinyl hydrolase 1 n=1 Tax=Lentinus brumalis TaxID=2498619 RepID=A0A371CW94_9APHY|nr:hypothetical protein OH76DRAFT_1466134 [Polyporus brumalis]